MEIRKKFKENIKIKDLVYLNELGAEIVEFYPKNDCLEGKLYVTGNYHSLKNDLDKLINYDILFTIVFDDNNFIVDDIECVSFEYNILEGYGVEVEYEVLVKYSQDENNDEDVKENEMIGNEDNIVVVENAEEIRQDALVIDDENEIIKEEISKDIDMKLSAKLNISANLPQNEEILRNINDSKTSIKVVYYKSDTELEAIAKSNECSIDSIYKSNQKNNLNLYKRVIIRNGK